VGDAVGAALVDALRARAESVPPVARARLLARADTLAAHYRERTPLAAALPPAEPAPRDASGAWRTLLEVRARARAARALGTDGTQGTERARATTSFVAELRATSATARAAEQVPSSAGPYHGAAVASRALDELLAIAPTYLGSYVEWLDDLARLAEVVERRASPRG